MNQHKGHAGRILDREGSVVDCAECEYIADIRDDIDQHAIRLIQDAGDYDFSYQEERAQEWAESLGYEGWESAMRGEFRKDNPQLVKPYTPFARPI